MTSLTTAQRAVMDALDAKPDVHQTTREVWVAMGAPEGANPYAVLCELKRRRLVGCATLAGVTRWWPANDLRQMVHAAHNTPGGSRA